MTTLAVGQAAPHFSLTGLDGKNYSLEKNGARLTLAVFFKTTCPTCILAFPYIEQLHQAYRDAGLAVWGVSQHDAIRSADFVIKYGSTFPVLVDDAWRVSQQYDPEFVPTMWLIDERSQIVDCVAAFDKAGLSRHSQTIAVQVGVAAVTMATDDGNPMFQPG